MNLPVIIHAPEGEIKQADGMVQFSGQSSDEAGLAAAGRSVEEIAASVRNTSILIPGIRRNVTTYHLTEPHRP